MVDLHRLVTFIIPAAAVIAFLLAALLMVQLHPRGGEL
jgi:TctA family transporter